jgi:hypothetical protein
MDSQRMKGERFLRYGALAANLDVKTYDVANVFVATTDGTAVAWSKLWWEYDVVFYNPQLPPGGLSDNGTIEGGGTASAAVPFGSLPAITGPLGISIVGPAVTVTGLTQGVEYIINYTTTGTVLGPVNPTLVGFTIKNGLPGSNDAIVNAAATVLVMMITVTATAATATITFNNTATTVTPSNLTYFTISSLIPAPAF